VFLITSLADGTGITFILLGDERRFRAMVDSADYWDPERCFGAFARYEMLPAVRPAAEAIRRLAEGPCSFVLAFAYAIGAAWAGTELGLPTVRVVLTPAAFTHDDIFARRAQMAAQVAGHAVRTIGLSRLESVPTIGLFPTWFRGTAEIPAGVVNTGFPLDDEAENLDPSLATFLATGAPPVIAFAGSERTRASALMAMLSVAIRQSGRRAIITPDSEITESCGRPIWWCAGRNA
jgi:hypothetical protein